MNIEKVIAAMVPHYELVTVNHHKMGDKSTTTVSFSKGQISKPAISIDLPEKPKLTEEEIKEISKKAKNIIEAQLAQRIQEMAIWGRCEN